MALEKLRRMGEFFKIVGREAEIAADGARDLVDDLRRWAPGRPKTSIDVASSIEAGLIGQRQELINQRKADLEAEIACDIEPKINRYFGRSRVNWSFTEGESRALGLMAGYLTFPPAECDPQAVRKAEELLAGTITDAHLHSGDVEVDGAVALGMLYQAHNERREAFVPPRNKKITPEIAKIIWRNNGLEGMPILDYSPVTGVSRNELYRTMELVKKHPGLERVFNSKGLSVEKRRMLYEELLEKTRRSRKPGPARASTPAVAPRAGGAELSNLPNKIRDVLDFGTRREIRTSPFSTRRELQITALAHARGITYAAAENQLEQTEHLVQAADHTAAAKRIAGGQTIVTKTPAPGWQMAIAKILHLPEE